MKRIILTQGKVALVDDADFDSLNQWKWRAANIKGRWYAYRVTHGSHKTRKSVAMHREIMGDLAAGKEVDHRDGDGLNNCRDNLRPATHAENMRNNRQKPSECGFRGVQKHGPSWQAKVSINGKLIAIGTFPTPEDAARAYDRVATTIHGEFVRTNFQ